MALATNDTAALSTLLGGLSLEPLPPTYASDSLVNPIEIWRAYLVQYLLTIVDCDPAIIHEAISSGAEASLGDLIVILPRLKLDMNGEKLRELAIDISKKLPKTNLFQFPWVDGTHIRMFFSPATLAPILLPYIGDRGSTYGTNPSLGLHDGAAKTGEEGGHRKRVVVEFSSPNIAGGFDSYHLRSTLLGAFAARMYGAMGWDVVRLNYIGDWGKPMGLLGTGYARFGSADELQQQGVRHLLQVYERIKELLVPEEQARKTAKDNGESTAGIEGQGLFAERDAFFAKMETGDEAARALWQQFRDITIASLEASYSRFGIAFDEYAGESQVSAETMAHAEQVLRDRGVLEESDGSWVIHFDKHMKKKGLGTQVVRGRDGATRYFLRDVGAVLERERKYSFDKMLYVVSARQENHFQQVFATLELMGLDELRQKLQHVSFGAVKGLQGPLLDDMLDRCAKELGMAQQERESAEAKEEAESKAKEGAGNAEAVDDKTAVAAMLVLDMCGKRAHGYTFEPRRMVASSTTHTSLWLQACYAKLTATIDELQGTISDDTVEANYTVLQDDNSTDLLRAMAQMPEVTALTFRSLEPHALLSYLFRVADSVYSSIDNTGEEDGEDGEEDGKEEEQHVETDNEKKAKLLLYQRARQVLENGMRLLGFLL